MTYAPIVLFVYNRPFHTRETVSALQKNTGAENSILYIYSDGPKESSKEEVAAVREYLSTITGFKEVRLILRENNMGLAASVIAGVTEVVNSHGRVIVMEDDLVTTPYFLQYMNEALEKYEQQKEVFSITGYSHFPEGNKKLQETYFAKLFSSWSWATWKDRWDYFDPDVKGWERLKTDKRLSKEFDYNGSFGKTHMMIQQMEEKSIDSWAIRWSYSIFQQQGLTLFPNKSLCRNIGFDGTGRHCIEDTSKTEYELHEGMIQYFPKTIKEEEQTKKQIVSEMAKERRIYLWGRFKYYAIRPVKLINRLKRTK